MLNLYLVFASASTRHFFVYVVDSKGLKGAML